MIGQPSGQSIALYNPVSFFLKKGFQLYQIKLSCKNIKAPKRQIFHTFLKFMKWKKRHFYGEITDGRGRGAIGANPSLYLVLDEEYSRFC